MNHWQVDHWQVDHWQVPVDASACRSSADVEHGTAFNQFRRDYGFDADRYLLAFALTADHGEGGGANVVKAQLHGRQVQARDHIDQRIIDAHDADILGHTLAH